MRQTKEGKRKWIWLGVLGGLVILTGICLLWQYFQPSVLQGNEEQEIFQQGMLRAKQGGGGLLIKAASL